MDALKKIGELGVVPVVKIDDAQRAPALAQALIAGGLPCAEITFRTGAAEKAISLISSSQPDLLLGAGTVLSVQHAEQAVRAGASFIVSPGFDPKVVEWCLARGVTMIPGIATPTEALMAREWGLSVLKFFPSEALGGIPMLQAVSSALVGLKFIPTGGLTIKNMADYLRLSMVHAVAGSWLATAKTIASGALDEITRLTAEAVAVVRRERSAGGGK